MTAAATVAASNAEPDFPGLMAHLERTIPRHCILSRVEDTRPYECDGLSLYRALPPVVVLPENEAQIIDVINTCRQFQIPIVARGAGTGLSGGAMPPPRGILLGTAKLNRIRSLDHARPAERRAGHEGVR